MLWSKLDVLSTVLQYEISLLMKLLLLLALPRSLCLTPKYNLFVISTRCQYRTLSSKLRICPSNPPHRSSMPLTSSHCLLTLPLILILFAIHLMPYLYFLIGTTSRQLIAIIIKLHIMHKVIVAEAERAYLIIH